MPTFLYPLPIAIIAGLIGLPILIHLINLMRHRQIQWAAMEFLLVSQKRNSTWVMLKQLLLLLLRMAAIAAVLAMVTQPIVQNTLGFVRRREAASHRAFGRQLFDVRRVGGHHGL